MNDIEFMSRVTGDKSVNLSVNLSEEHKVDMYFYHINLKESIHTHDFLRLYRHMLKIKLMQVVFQSRVKAKVFTAIVNGHVYLCEE